MDAIDLRVFVVTGDRGLQTLIGMENVGHAVKQYAWYNIRVATPKERDACMQRNRAIYSGLDAILIARENTMAALDRFYAAHNYDLMEEQKAQQYNTWKTSYSL